MGYKCRYKKPLHQQFGRNRQKTPWICKNQSKNTQKKKKQPKSGAYRATISEHYGLFVPGSGTNSIRIVHSPFEFYYFSMKFKCAGQFGSCIGKKRTSPNWIWWVRKPAVSVRADAIAVISCTVAPKSVHMFTTQHLIQQLPSQF